MIRTLALVTALAAGCAASQPTEMVEVANPSTAPRPADQLEIQFGNVTVRSVDYTGGDIFQFIVMNLRPEPVLVDRDAVVLVLPTGERLHRLPGGVSSVYTVPAAGSHQVNVKFDVSALHLGDYVRVDFAQAVRLVGGGQLPLPPLVLTYH